MRGWCLVVEAMALLIRFVCCRSSCSVLVEPLRHTPWPLVREKLRSVLETGTSRYEGGKYKDAIAKLLKEEWNDWRGNKAESSNLKRWAPPHQLACLCTHVSAKQSTSLVAARLFQSLSNSLIQTKKARDELWKGTELLQLIEGDRPPEPSKAATGKRSVQYHLPPNIYDELMRTFKNLYDLRYKVMKKHNYRQFEVWVYKASPS